MLVVAAAVVALLVTRPVLVELAVVETAQF
jgi:hypothetical protein